MSLVDLRANNIRALEGYVCREVATDVEHIIYCASQKTYRSYKTHALHILYRCTEERALEKLRDEGAVVFVTTPSSHLITISNEHSIKDKFVSFLEAVSSEEIYEASHGDACKKCGSRKLHNDQKQTRSGDESMTLFVTCMNCGKRWKM